MSKLTLGEISSSLQKEYQGKFINQLNTEPYFSRIIREESERKEKAIREALEPWRLWLVDHIKWRRAKKWLVRGFVIQEHVVDGWRIIRVYKGKKLLNYEEVRLGPEPRFVRHRFQGGD